VRLIDIVFRQGHLSDRSLVDAIASGTRPLHLDRCDLCAERTVELARWMDDVQADAAELADHVFTPERLAAQQHQILRRLEQLDHPARVISFPAGAHSEPQGLGRRRVAVSWVGVAAAAGLLIGLVGGQVSARLGHQSAAPAITANAGDTSVSLSPDTSTGPVNGAVLAEPIDNLDIKSLSALDEATPKMVQISARR
jgi:hypothetical protein